MPNTSLTTAALSARVPGRRVGRGTLETPAILEKLGGGSMGASCICRHTFCISAVLYSAVENSKQNWEWFEGKTAERLAGLLFVTG